MTDELIVPTPPDLMVHMVRLQQGLLAAGYTYALGDTETWPRSSVVMTRDERFLLLAYGPPDDPTVLQGPWHQLLGQVPSAGLLLVGDAPVDSPRVHTTFAALGGTVLYLDATTRQSVIRHAAPPAPELMSETAFPAFLGAVQAGQGAEIDAGAALRTAMAAALPARPGVPWLTYAFIAVCVAIALLDFGQAKDAVTRLTPLRQWGVLFGPWVRAGEWYRLLSHGLLHGDITHLLFNMMALYYIGPALEAWQGRWRLALIFTYSVLVGGILSLVVFPATPSLGASGGLFGLMGAIGAVLARHRAAMDPATRKGIGNWLLQTLGINAFISLLPGINWMAHAGGLLGGFVITWLIANPPGHAEPLAPTRRLALAALLVATLLLAGTVIGGLPGAG
jgi:rhomboid protease GluP